MTKPADEFCRETIAGIKKKADHNKSEALWAFGITIAATLSAPLFITLGESWIFAKLVPSLLSIIAAAATSWLQLRRPQHLWGLYRGAQRQLEDQMTGFEYRIGEYEPSPDPSKLLAERVAAICLELHHKWMPMIPNLESVGSTQPLKSPISILEP
jgi:hypothetical protein